MKKLNKILLAALAVTLFSCDNDFDNPVEEFQVSKGQADFSKYIAIGNSLTSGYTDNALFKSGQENSYPNILAGLMKAAGGGEFKTPFMKDDIGGFTNLNLAGKLQLQIVNGSLTPVPTAAQSAFESVAAAGPYQNVGIPGAKSFHLIAPGYGNPAGIANATANPYFARFNNAPAGTLLSYVAEQKPTFFSLWIGNNDVLGYATAGGTGVDQKGNVNPATYGSADISDPNVVKGAINTVLKTLIESGAKGGVIANIPSVTSVPYFTTVPAKPITGLSESIANTLNSAQGYGAYNAGLAQAKAAGLLTDAEYQARLIKFTAGEVANGAVIVDKDLTNLAALGLPSYRQTTDKDMIVFTAASILPQGQGTQVPLEDKWVLTEKEAAKAEAAVKEYNAAILELANAYNLALVDTYSEMQKLSSQSGIRYYGNTYTTTFVSGGAFSLDGIHLTGTGYAIVANMFVEAINKKYGSTLRQVYPGNYPGVKIP